MYNDDILLAAYNKGWTPYHLSATTIDGVVNEKYIAFAKPEGGVLRGDVNNDGSVNTGDISEIYGIILGNITDPETIARAKINDDDVVNTGDVSELYSIILGQ